MIKKNDFFRLIKEENFRELFVTELGWNRFRGQATLPVITVDEHDFQVTAIAERNGFQVLVCDVDEIPTQSLARKIDSKLRRQAADYICIYRLRGAEAHHLWVVPVRQNEKRDLVLVEYEQGKADVIFQKIEGFTFALDEVTNIVDLRAKVQGAFAVNSEKITKDFYAGFKKQHAAFADFITGMDDEVPTKTNRSKQWYTSVMLNRLMFCYFIQKKGFLNLDTDYLRHKLNWVRENEGDGKFFSFYRSFLRHLFHDGLNTPKHEVDFVRDYGKIPYLNGGMFDEHQLEKDYAGVDIDDQAFINLFDFFDKWNWHLDTRLTASGKDINPDVLGYIFEQYINDRAQMGAYYTKEDITEYIGRNCILPFLFDRVRTATKESARDFEPDGFVWSTLRQSGDRYIFDAVKKGYDLRDQIPENIRRGIITEEMRHEYAETPIGELPEGHVPLSELRSDWNQRTPEQFALPTEIWRETIERLDRCDSILRKIQGGEIVNINDFITYNLDIRTFALDLIARGDNKFVGHFYKALQHVTILDPTCGSGAFLFAALNILEPLYEACIDRMQDFNRENPRLFKDELAEIAGKYRSNIQYFIYKSIILRNLYGVDIMVEATEIAKLRLFLKMVAVVDVDRRADNLGLDPLPDIDFNIRAGNTLVGYANEEQLNRDLSNPKDILEELANQEFKETIDTEMEKVAVVYERFKELQLHQDEDMLAFKESKRLLHERLASLNRALNHRLYLATNAPSVSGEEAFRRPEYYAWLRSHQPFHWLAEFYGIIHGNHGFDVIIGNPPYVTFTERSLSYQVDGYKTFSTKNLFALCAERFLELIRKNGSIGYIIPLSGMSIEGFEPLQRIMYRNRISWNSFYSGDRNPSELFSGVKIRAGIYLSRGEEELNMKFTGKYIKYQASERQILFPKISYTKDDSHISSPKIPSKIGCSIISKIESQKKRLNEYFTRGTTIYYHAAPIHWGKCLAEIKTLETHNLNIADSYKQIVLDIKARDFAFILLNSSTFFYYWIAFSDCYNLTKKYFGIGIPNWSQSEVTSLAKNLNTELFDNMQIAEYTYKNRGAVRFAQFFPKLSKPIIDEIDRVLAKHYGFTEEELDFIINYDIKYRMGDELNADE